MRAQLSNRPSLWQVARAGGLPPARFVNDPSVQTPLADILGGTTLGEGLAGRSVLIQTARQTPAIQALLELDGVARRLVLAPPGIRPDHLDAVIEAASIDTLVADDPAPRPGLHRRARTAGQPFAPLPDSALFDTEWVLFTSGTTGTPKLVSHTLAGLTGPTVAAATTWSTFYDVRRYGGLQILLRALTGGGSMVLSDAEETLPAFLARAGAAGVTHISGTPSHWRRVLMSGHARCMDPATIRLSGEIADQALLDRLHATYPAARVVHAFASTEAGVAFDVADGQAGFPAAWVDGPAPSAELRVAPAGAAGDTLRIRSPRTAGGYLGGAALLDADGFVDTGDIVARHGERFRFLGRAGGVINVGGQKVHPEEVEAVLNAHPAVVAARVHARRSPIVGAVVAADVVTRRPGATKAEADALRADILHACRAQLTAFKVPALLQFVAGLEMLPSGKLARPNA